MPHELTATEPDFSTPLDFDAELRGVRPGTTVKGMFIQRVYDDAARAGVSVPGVAKYTAFRDYPISAHVDALREVAKRQFPGLPAREALRRIGRAAYDTLRESMMGRVLFGVLGRDIVAITRLVPKVYSLAQAEAEVLHVDENGSVIRLANVALVDSYQVGAFEGVLAVCELEGVVKVRRLGPGSAELHTAFWKRGSR